MNGYRIFFAVSFCLPGFVGPLAGQEITEIVVTARRLPIAANERVYAITRIDHAALVTAPERRLDDLLRSIPGFGLFRRSSSRVAHPTTQGVSLRGLGPNGAGRTLVTLDGVPLNDPFGGWIYWNKLPAATIGAVEVLRGGGSGPWGNAALAGVVRLHSRRLEGNAIAVEGSYGNRDSWDILVSANAHAGSADFFVTGSRIATDGHHILRQDQRGAVDIAAFSEAYWVEGGMTVAPSDDLSVTVKAGYFAEDRGNGTALATNGTDAFDASLSVVRLGSPDAIAWEAHFYLQKRDFENQFASVTADRDAETPALNQFDVPANGIGFNAILRLPESHGHQTEGGVDFRYADGATNERFFFSGGGFLRQRNAGGEQVVTGLFLEHIWRPTEALILTAGARLDYWRNWDGQRVEHVIADGAILRSEIFPERGGWIGNFRVGVAYRPRDFIELRGAAYSGFRVPTINELYRPFRVRSDITEANPALTPERLYGGEVGLRVNPDNRLEAEVTFFSNRLGNAVTNVFLTDEPGFNGELGVFVPAGGTLSQRRNLERIHVNGVETRLALEVTRHWRMTASYLFVDPVVKRSPDQPLLIGNRLAQTPRHQVTLSALANTRRGLRGNLQLRAASAQFEDNLNSRRLKGFVTVDGFVGYRLGDRVEIFATVENLFDRLVEVGKTGTGLVSIGAPRLWSLGLRLAR